MFVRARLWVVGFIWDLWLHSSARDLGVIVFIQEDSGGRLFHSVSSVSFGRVLVVAGFIPVRWVRSGAPWVL